MRNPNMLNKGDLIKVTLADTRRQQDEYWNLEIAKTVGEILTVSRITRHWRENSKNSYIKKLKFLIEVEENSFYYEADWVEFWIPTPSSELQPKNQESQKSEATTQQMLKMGFTLVKPTISSNFSGPYAEEYEALMRNYHEEYYG
jgi:hypothetical protein